MIVQMECKITWLLCAVRAVRVTVCVCVLISDALFAVGLHMQGSINPPLLLHDTGSNYSVIVIT